MGEKKRYRARRPALLSALGFVLPALIAGFIVYESTKGRGVTMARDREAVAADRMNAQPPIDASQPKTIETATFALG